MWPRICLRTVRDLGADRWQIVADRLAIAASLDFTNSATISSSIQGMANADQSTPNESHRMADEARRRALLFNRFTVASDP